MRVRLLAGLLPLLVIGCLSRSAFLDTNGSACVFDGECSSGNCVVGLCCDAPCSGGCEACSADGECAPLAEGSAGECGPYLCDGTSGECPEACEEQSHCEAPNACNLGSCCVWSSFSPPVDLGVSGWLGSVSADGLTIFHSRWIVDNNDLYTSTRPSLDEPFGAEVPVTELNTAGTEGSAVLMPDGLTLYLSAEWAGGVGSDDLWRVVRASPSSPFGDAVNLTELNSPQRESSFCLREGGLAAYFVSNRQDTDGSWDHDVYLARREERTSEFSAPAKVAELCSDAVDRSIWLSEDGLEAFVASERAGGLGMLDIWRLTRTDMDAPFETPENVTELNTAWDDLAPHLSSDGTTFYFNYDTDTGGGRGTHVWQATRQCLPE